MTWGTDTTDAEYCAFVESERREDCAHCWLAGHPEHRECCSCHREMHGLPCARFGDGDWLLCIRALNHVGHCWPESKESNEANEGAREMSQTLTAKFYPKPPSSLSTFGSASLKDSKGKIIGSVWVDGDCVAHVTSNGSFIELPQKFVGMSIGNKP
jgi:hypothetical protein